MNELNKKEEEIKDILGGLEIDIDTNDIWANIESDLPPLKKKRRFGIFILLSLLGLGAFSLSWSLSSSDDIDFANDTHPNITTANNNTESLVKNTIEENEIQIENSLTKKIQDINAISTIEKIKYTEKNNIPSVNTITSSIEKRNNSQNSILQESTYQVDINPSNTYQETTIGSVVHETSSSVPNNEENNLTSPLFSQSRSNINAIHLTPTLTSNLLDMSNRNLDEYSPTFITPNHTNGRQLILQFKLGANQNISSISDINSSGEFCASEFEFERDRIGLSGSLAIGVENKGWRFLASMSYHHHISTYERNDVVIVKDSNTGVQSYKISPNGNISSQTGTVTVSSVRENSISYHRQHRALDFSATIGKRLWSYKGLILIADAGLGINTMTHTSGYYLQDKAFGFNLISNEDHPYKVNTHWNAIASLEIGYDFGKTRIGLSPFIRYNPNSITSQTHLYQLKNSQVGMQLSLTYSPTRE